MMSDLMREEFEAWVKTRWPETKFYRISEDSGAIYTAGHYSDSKIQIVWESWQASREALVIELPLIHRDDYSSAYGMNCAIRAVNMIKPRIHAAGVKTK